MSEVFGWPQGSLYVYTGTATASALVMYARNTQVNLQRGWDTRPSLSGIYHDHLTGVRADITTQIQMNNNWTLMRMFDSATAVHFHFRHGNPYGSAGIYLYSGRIDGIQLAGSENQPYTYTLMAHSNAWSAYGGNT